MIANDPPPSAPSCGYTADHYNCQSARSNIFAHFTGHVWRRRHGRVCRQLLGSTAAKGRRGKGLRHRSCTAATRDAVWGLQSSKKASKNTQRALAQVLFRPGRPSGCHACEAAAFRSIHPGAPAVTVPMRMRMLLRVDDSGPLPESRRCIYTYAETPTPHACSARSPLMRAHVGAIAAARSAPSR